MASTNSSSLLDFLRTKSQVDCDTLDVTVAEELGPFVDCTSNQAIAYSELQKLQHASLIQSSVKLAKDLAGTDGYRDVELPSLAVEIMMIKLSLLIVPHITGFLHVQVNPLYSYSSSTMSTISAARRITRLYTHLAPPDFPVRKRVCIKIPSTWNGLEACRALEKEGIKTLATTLFSNVQASLAAEAGCTYIAPYVNALQVHFVPGFVDEGKGFRLCVRVQRWYKRMGYKTQVLPASLISITEVLQLASADHITVSPHLIRELAAKSYDPATTVSSLFDEDMPAKDLTMDHHGAIKDETEFKLAMDQGSMAKLTKALEIFCEMQKKLEEIANSCVV